MGPSFNEQFDQHGAWRRAFAQQLKQLAEWMSGHDLMDAAVQERLQRLENQVRTDKVMVAFVAEFSRGKSELINAIFLHTMVVVSCLQALGAPPCAQQSWAGTLR